MLLLLVLRLLLGVVLRDERHARRENREDLFSFLRVGLVVLRPEARDRGVRHGDVRCSIDRGIDHRRLTYRYQGRDFRLTDIHGHVLKDIIS